MIDFTQLSVFLNGAIFAAAAVVVWLAGVRLTHFANAISAKTGLGQAVIGMLLLGGVTSLPEIGATVTSAASGAAALAFNNLMGSIAAQVAILAMVDMLGRKALTSSVPDPMVLLQGGLNVLLLTIVVAGIVTGDTSILGVGAWAWVIGLAYAFAIYILGQSQGRRSWVVATHGKVDRHLEKEQQQAQEKANTRLADRSLRDLILWTIGLGAVILVAGYLLSRTGDALAGQTGLGGSFTGFVLLAFATSLPELSTSITAVREGLYTLAVSDILGTNLINVGLVFIIDLVAQGEPILSQAGRFDMFGALLGIAVTALFMIGMAERGDKTVFRMGLDSVAVLLCYGGGLVILYFLRGSAS